MSYKSLKITNKSFGNFNGIVIFIDESLHKKLEKEKAGEGGTMLQLFQKGMAVRGLKHLITLLKENNNQKKIVITENPTTKNDNEWLINYEDYRSTTSKRFYSFYRETGLDVARLYLSNKFPEDFQYSSDSQLTEAQVKKVDKNLPEVLKKLEKKARNKKEILKSTTNIIQGLKEKRSLLKTEVDQLETLQSESNIAVMLNNIKELEKRLSSGKQYRETSGKNSWQSWIYSRNWMFGSYYLKPIEKQRVGLDSIPDYLFPTIDGFLDILEIKLPTQDVIQEDSSHSGSFMWTSKSSGAIGQVVTYLSEIELNQLMLQQKIKEKYDLDLNVLKPRAYILIGNNDGWSQSKKRSFRTLNYSLHGIEVLTYSDLKSRANQIVKIYNNKLGN